jgi:hypothetical protein
VVLPNAERLKRLIADLDHDTFRVREAVAKELARCGQEIEPALREALAGKPSLESRRRIQDLLTNLRRMDSPDALRSSRALQTLERMGGANARQLLEELAAGAPQARLTEEAKAARERLGQH